MSKFPTTTDTLLIRTHYRDTVCSVGLIPRRLPFVSSNTAIRFFRHAVSLDERRSKFKANLYNRPTDKESKLGVQPGEMPTPRKEVGGSPTNGAAVTGLWDSVMSGKWAQFSDPDKTLTDKTLTGETLKLFSELQESIERTASRSRSPSADAVVTKYKQKDTSREAPPPKPLPRKETTVDSDSDENDVRHESLYASLDEDGCGDANCDSQPSPGAKRPETDVLEVWFAGCHCGPSIVLDNPKNTLT